MRVLMVNRSDMHATPGGDTVQMNQTALELRNLGVTVETSTLDGIPPLRQFDLVHIFNWETFESFFNIQTEDFSFPPPLVLSPIFWFHSGHWYDDAVSSTWGWGLLGRALGRPKGRSLYEWWQGAKMRWGSRGKKMRRLLSVAAHLLPNSCTEHEHMRSVFGIREDMQARSTIVPNGVIRRLFDPLPHPSKDFMNEYGIRSFVLQVGRIQSAKNQLGLIEALYDTDLPLVFVGQFSAYEIEYAERCQRLARQRGNVHFVPPKAAEELAGIYTLAAVHVLPSWRETPGLVSLEAAAAGCRIVSTRNGSAAEYFGSEAWYCDPRDPDSIRRAVLEALNSPPSDRLRNKVLSCYTWEAAAQKTLEAYNKALL